MTDGMTVAGMHVSWGKFWERRSTWTLGMASDMPKPLTAQNSVAACIVGAMLNPSVMQPQIRHPPVITQTRL